jgi:hypothetical protein
MKPAYLVYRATIARPLGQANVPFNVEESQRGPSSWIDTIDTGHHGQVDFRAWVRAYAESNGPLYVGIYTVLRRDDTGFVSCGWDPVPDLLLRHRACHPVATASCSARRLRFARISVPVSRAVRAANRPMSFPIGPYGNSMWSLNVNRLPVGVSSTTQRSS